MHPLPELRRFITDWRAVTSERSITDLARWSELMQTYHAAQQAVTNQIAAWQQEGAQELHGNASSIERARASSRCS